MFFFLFFFFKEDSKWFILFLSLLSKTHTHTREEDFVGDAAIGGMDVDSLCDGQDGDHRQAENEWP